MPARIALGGNDAYDRMAERRQDDKWLRAAWEAPSTRVLLLAGSRMRASDGVPHWVPPSEVPEGGVRVLLGQDAAGRVSFAQVLPKEVADDSWVGLRAVLTATPAADAAYVVHAVGIAEWLLMTQFCPRCGGRLEPTHAGHVLHSPDCGRDQFPRSDPAVIMLVTDSDDRALLGRQRVWPVGRWSTLAGFVEPGESLESAVRREVHEEVGVDVGAVTYFGSQPWPLPGSMMVGFVARAETTDITVDGDEIEEAQWFTRDEALAGADSGGIQMPSGISISRSLIEHWFGDRLPGEWR